MKQLALLRHAKSSWDNPGISDFDRPLSQRGLRDAPRMGALLKARGLQPDLMVSSTAVRARSTAEITARELGLSPASLQFTDALYHADPDAMLDVVISLGTDAGCVVLVGHNPGITELANRVAADARIDNLPTAGCFCIEADIDDWADLRHKPGRLLFFVSPKNDLSAEG